MVKKEGIVEGSKYKYQIPISEDELENEQMEEVKEHKKENEEE